MIVKFMAPSAIEMDNVKVSGMSVEGRPLFYGKGFDAVIGVINVMDDSGKVLTSTVLRVSGKTGAVSVSDKTNPVKPAMERPKQVHRKAAEVFK